MTKRLMKKMISGFAVLAVSMILSGHGTAQEGAPPVSGEEVQVREIEFNLETMGLIWIQEGEVKRLAYVVQTGDTMWDIAARYLNSPYYWPKIWERNSFIINPNLIFPGDILYIYPEGVAEKPGYLAGATIPVVKSITKEKEEKKREIYFTAMSSTGFVSTEELDEAHRIIKSDYNKALLGEADVVWVNVGKKDRVLPGDRYSIIRKKRNPLINKVIEIRHPVTGEVVGFQVSNLGELTITKVGLESSEAVIDSSNEEIHVGDLIVPFLQPLEEEFEVVPAEVEYLKGYIIANRNDVKLIGVNDIVYIDKGSEDGVARGNLFQVYKPCEILEDKVTGEPILIPEQIIGELVILEPHEHTSVALVLSADQEITYGDRVIMSKYDSWEIEGISAPSEVEACNRDPKCRLITKEEYESGMTNPYCESDEVKTESRFWKKKKK